jgi:methionyl-tRNA formyltransferase
MRLVYFASEAFAVPVLNKLASSNHKVLAVVTRACHGTYNRPLPEPSIACEAEKLRIPLIVAGENAPSHGVETLQDMKADLGIVSVFGEELPDPLKLCFPAGCVEIHPSLLPKYRGPVPIRRAIHNDEKKTGVTVFRVIDQPYAGPILVQRETMIKPGETWAELHFRLARIACDALDATLKMLERDFHFSGGSG